MSIITNLFGEFIIASSIQGLVFQNNLPVAGATIVREVVWGWNSEKITDQQTTADSGKFQFGEIKRSSFFANWLPHEVDINIKITIEHKGRTYRAFVTHKRDYKSGSEFGDKPGHLVCDLDAQSEAKETHFGICQIVDKI